MMNDPPAILPNYYYSSWTPTSHADDNWFGVVILKAFVEDKN